MNDDNTDERDWISFFVEENSSGSNHKINSTQEFKVENLEILKRDNLDDWGVEPKRTYPSLQQFKFDYSPPDVDVWLDSDDSLPSETQALFDTNYTKNAVNTLEPIHSNIQQTESNTHYEVLLSKSLTSNQTGEEINESGEVKNKKVNITIPSSDFHNSEVSDTNRFRNISSLLVTSTIKSSRALVERALHNAVTYIESNSYVASATDKLLDAKGLVVESAAHASDRLSSWSTNHVLVPFTADNPETRHVLALVNDPSWDSLPLRCSLASLTWSQLRLVNPTRTSPAQDSNPSPNLMVVASSTVLKFLFSLGDNIYHGIKKVSNSTMKNTLSSTTSEESLNSLHSNGDTDNDDDNDNGMSKYKQALLDEKWIDDISTDPAAGIASVVPSQRADQWWLVERAKRGDVEAQFALTRWFCPPEFHNKLLCEVCEMSFGPRVFRHHCRMCGRSLCDVHSMQRRTILHLGFSAPVRCCMDCSVELDREAHYNQLHWRELRVKAYLSNSLIPFSSAQVDTRVDKVLRVVDCSLLVAKKTVVFNYPAYLFLQTVDILRRYGMSGLAGVLLRRDFLDAVETLKRISGVDKMFRMSLHELTACIYYKLAIDRGLRGCDPDGEKILHDEHVKVLSQRHARENSSVLPSNDEHDNEPETEMRRTTRLSQDLTEAIRMAPLALQAVYEETAEECQRLAASQGWRTVLCCTDSAPEQPAYALFATDTDVDSRSNGRKEAVLAIRGTSSVHDLVTDIRSAPHRFPPSPQEVRDALDGTYRPRDSADRYGSAQQVQSNVGGEEVENDGFVPVTISQWEWTRDMKDQRYACRGMAVSALWLLSQVAPSLITLSSHGYNIIITGHSLGAGVSALMTDLLQDRLPTVRAVVFGCPSCVDNVTAVSLKDRVLSVILRDDFISRVTPQTIRQLMRELMVFRSQVFRHLEQDWRDVIARAGSLWSPRWRDTHLQSNTSSLSSIPTTLVSTNTSISPATVQSITSSTPIATSIVVKEDDKKKEDEMKGEDQIEPSAPFMMNDAISFEDPNRVKETGEDSSSEVFVPEEAIPELWLPGRILHLYTYRGQYRVAEVGPDFESLRRIEVQGNMFVDHTSNDIFDSLLEARSVLSATAEPPVWTAYDKTDRCECCQSAFTWHSTFRGEAQEYRERYNCRQCGQLVCDPCSTKRRPVPRLGLIFPSRICDRCFFRGDYAFPG